jgi:hypothetical protein
VFHRCDQVEPCLAAARLLCDFPGSKTDSSKKLHTNSTQHTDWPPCARTLSSIFLIGAMQETSLLTQFRLCPSRGLSRSIELNAENNDVLTYVKVLAACIASNMNSISCDAAARRTLSPRFDYTEFANRKAFRSICADRIIRRRRRISV